MILILALVLANCGVTNVEKKTTAGIGLGALAGGLMLAAEPAQADPMNSRPQFQGSLGELESAFDSIATDGEYENLDVNLDQSAWAIFSPTTDPIEPMMKEESVTAKATRRARIMPVPTTAASRRPVRSCSLTSLLAYGFLSTKSSGSAGAAASAA